MKKVLVTGASGFIGKHILPHLLGAGFEVHGTYFQHSLESLPKGKGMNWHKVNLLDRAGTDAVLEKIKATHLLHLAWYAEPGRFWDAPQNFDWLQASSGLLRAFAKNGGKRFVGAGTCAEYDWKDGKLNESSSLIKPATLYGSCKSNFLKYAEPFCKENNVSCAWGRLFWLYGPGEDERRIVPSVITSLLSGEEAQCTESNQKRDFMHVGDAARALAALLASDKEGAFNIASGQAVTLKDLISHIGKLVDKESLLKFGAKETPPGEAPLVVADISRLYHELNFRSEMNLDTGLRETISWWQRKIFS